MTFKESSIPLSSSSMILALALQAAAGLDGARHALFPRYSAADPERTPSKEAAVRDPRLDKLADVLVRYSVGVKPGDLVAIVSEAVAMPLIEATAEAVIRAGG